MKVRAIKSFAGIGFAHAEGQVFDLPEGVDWLTCGLVEPVEDEPEAPAPEPQAEPAPAPAKPKRTRKPKP